MKLRIHHETTYRYRSPVALQAHRLMLIPRGTHDLQVLDQSLHFSPNAETEWTQDVFGNLVVTASFSQPAQELSIVSNVIVQQRAPAWPVFTIATSAHTYPFAYAQADIVDVGALLAPAKDHPGDTLDSWAKAFVLGPGTDTLSLLKDLNTGVGSAIAYRVRDEEGTQSPAETLSIASGSCRDIAALFIDVARRLGFGARAVSGYLYDPDVSLEDAGSTHAWAEVYLPSAGWIAFDPTHRRVGSANLIPVAVARCNRQIMPVAGGYLGAPEDFIDMDVRVQVTPA